MCQWFFDEFRDMKRAISTGDNSDCRRCENIKLKDMDRFGMVIERQGQIEQLIKEWGFLPFFKSGIEGFSIEEICNRGCIIMQSPLL